MNKRRDKRGRILHSGECQLPDGRYRYKYTDSFGKHKYVYSLRLDHNDPMPKGHKSAPALRDLEKQIQADMFDHIVSNGGNLTVLDLVEKYISTKINVRDSTKTGYKHIREKCNSIYRVPLPLITPHVCRHTYCSNMAKSGMNPKTLQYLMGYSDISVTLNTYTHVHYEDVAAEVSKLGVM